MLFEERESAGVGEGVAGDGYGEVVAAVFALAADLLGDPPDGGVVEEQSFDDGLEDADEVVVAADVGELVGEDGFDLGGREAGEASEGHEDDGAEPADDGGDLDQRGV